MGCKRRLKLNKNQVVERKLTSEEESKRLREQLKSTQKILSYVQILKAYYQQVIEAVQFGTLMELEKSPLPSNHKNDGAIHFVPVLSST